VELLASWPMWSIGVVGLALYVMVVGTISAIEWRFSGGANAWVRATDGSAVRWWDIVYFNFISILTIGYGDYGPSGNWARFVTILEAVLGTGILGVTLAALTAKFLSPPKNAVVFSRYAYYCTDDQKLLVIYLNTTRSRLVNPEISSYFKLGGDWRVRPSVRSPFVTRAVQTFFTDFVLEDDLVDLLNEASDAFRFGISGQLGAASFSVAIEYKPSDILVLGNRNDLISYPGFWDPDFRSTHFQKMFHYRPAGSSTLTGHIEMLRQQRRPKSPL
jgi:hypothetical protein